MTMQYRLRVGSFKGRIPKGTLVEVLHKGHNDVWTVTDNLRVDTVHRFDVERVEVQHAENIDKY